ncbi:tetratricopeptide repeat protein [Microvirga subterranea]|uniref:Tetratricopeptide repeat protein n=2 Tax=Microvirga subterranea TaxID=186651 RepID=A0A370HUH2_9HYPH|nr:tetratricopeptide repeat protein [Microvirga subterranea]
MLIRRPSLRARIAGLLMVAGLGLAGPVQAQAPEELVANARRAAGTNDNREAARLFEQAIQLAPTRRREWLPEYADQLAYAGRPSEAVPVYRELLADPGLDPATRQRVTRSLAFALLWSSQFEEAIDAWQPIADANPGDAEARRAIVDSTIGAARAAAERGASQEAVPLFERAITLNPSRRPEIAREYADQLAYAGRPQQAVPIYREVLGRQDLAPEERQRATRNLAFALLWSSQFPEAIRSWETILRGSPADDEARKALSDALVGSARQAAEARRNADAAAFFRRAIETAPQRRQELLPEYADQIAYGGQPAQAVPLYREGLRQGGRSDQDLRRLRRGLAFGLLWSGQPREAVTAFEDVLRQAPDDAEARKGLADAQAAAAKAPGASGTGRAPGSPGTPAAGAGTQTPAPAQPAGPADAAIAEARAAAGRGANKEAFALFERAIRLDPSKRSQIAREYADQLAYAGEPARAVPVYREVLDRRDLPADERRQATRALAFALLWSSQFPSAIETWGTILRNAPDDSEARKALSDAYVGAARHVAGRSRNAEAADFFRRAIETAPQRRQELLPEYADQIAYSGKPDRAVPLYREALRSGERTAQETQRLRRGLAFALLWSSQFREAIPALQAILKQSPRDNDVRKALADAYVGAARQTAGQGRSPEAVVLFERAFAVEPGRRRELLREYAEQVLYAGQPARAIPLFEEVLRRPDLTAKETRHAKLGLARALAWSGQQPLAIPVFTDILASSPNDVDALIGRGNALNDITRHKEALVDFEAVLRLQPANVDATRGAATAERSMGLPRRALARIEPLLASGDRNPATLLIAAQARQEMGRPDLAQSYAEALLARKPGDETAQRLLDQLFQERRPLTTIEAWHARRSDDLSISTFLISHELTFNAGLTKFGPQARAMHFEGGDFPTVDIYSIGVAGRHRFNDVLEFKSSLFLNLEDEPDDQDVEVTHETTLSFIPSDVIRLDLNLARRYPDENTRSIVKDVFADDVGFSVDYTPDNAFRISGRGIYSHYTDGNERVWGQAEIAKRFSADPYLWFGLRYTAFDFARVLDNGYWNPDRYQSFELSMQLWGTLAEHWTYDFQGAAGYGLSDPGSGGFVSYASARIAYEFAPQATFALYANHILSYARSSDDNNFDVLQDDEPWSRFQVGAQLRLRW